MMLCFDVVVQMLVSLVRIGQCDASVPYGYICQCLLRHFHQVRDS